jgi:hypothetical protein
MRATPFPLLTPFCSSRPLPISPYLASPRQCVARHQARAQLKRDELIEAAREREQR